MKNNIIFATLILLGTNYFQISAQNSFDNLEDKKIESIVSYSKQPFEESKENKAIRMEYFRSLEIKKSKEITVYLTRIKQKTSSSITDMDIDTDAPFPNNDFEKSALENYLERINKPITINLNKKEDEVKILNNIWIAQLPHLHSIGAFSGVFLERNPPNLKGWTDTLSVNGEIYVNKYTIESEGMVKLQGEQITKSRIEASIDDKPMEIPSNGAGLEAKSIGKKMNYNATIDYNTKTLFIRRIVGEVATSETLVVMGQRNERSIKQYFRILNK